VCEKSGERQGRIREGSGRVLGGFCKAIGRVQGGFRKDCGSSFGRVLARAWPGSTRFNPAGMTAKQRSKTSRAVERCKIVEASNVGCADVDLGHRPTPRALHHLEPAIGFKIDTHFLDAVNAARFEELLCALTVGANCRGVHEDWRHGRRSARFETGYASLGCRCAVVAAHSPRSRSVVRVSFMRCSGEARSGFGAFELRFGCSQGVGQRCGSRKFPRPYRGLQAESSGTSNMQPDCSGPDRTALTTLAREGLHCATLPHRPQGCRPSQSPPCAAQCRPVRTARRRHR